LHPHPTGQKCAGDPKPELELTSLFGENVHINEKPLLGGTLLATPEGGVKVLFPAVATQRQPDPGEDSLIIPGRTVEIPEQAGIRSILEPTFAQYDEAAERSDGIRLQVDKLTPEKVHDGEKEFSRRKAKPSNEMGFKTDNGAVIYRGNIESVSRPLLNFGVLNDNLIK
jgi:hypothetical protein